MNRIFRRIGTIHLSIALGFGAVLSLNAQETPKEELISLYDQYRTIRSDINQHLPILKELAKMCASVTEISTRNTMTTWAILLGLSENSEKNKVYTEIDVYKPALEKLFLSRRIAQSLGINFKFIEGNDMGINIEPTDMLFIDSLHTYCHLTYELERFSPIARKFLVMHDTSPPWGYHDDSEYRGDYSEYPDSIDKTKRGLWPAIDQFLSQHPEWTLKERRFNNHGLTILERVSDKK